MNLGDIPVGNWMWSLFVEIGNWLQPVVYIMGLGIAAWAFLRCRKPGYLVLGIYFALVVFWLLAGVDVWKAIWDHQTSDISKQTRQKIELADRQATDQVLKDQSYHSIPAATHIYFPLGPIVLVAGVWLLARRETPVSS
jgi:hypothetical protein